MADCGDADGSAVCRLNVLLGAAHTAGSELIFFPYEEEGNSDIEYSGVKLTFCTTSRTPNLVKEALKRAGFKLYRNKSGGWMGTWGGGFKLVKFRSLLPHQRVNHFPCTGQMSRKDSLALNIGQLARKYPAEFNFIPATYKWPQQSKEVQAAFAKRTSSQAWIVKPCASARGIGIRVVTKLSQLPERKAVIVQKYLSKPYLIGGFKFDLRLYVAVTSYDPPRVYLFNDGLVRFATEPYAVGKGNWANSFSHLTNYSINKKNNAFDDDDDDGCGSKWSLSALKSYFAEEGVNDAPIWEEIKEIIVKTVLSIEGHVVPPLQSLVKGRGVCFEVFGFDVILDSKLKPWLLEVNKSPSLHGNAPIDRRIKGAMITDLLNLAKFRTVPRKRSKQPPTPRTPTSPNTTTTTTSVSGSSKGKERPQTAVSSSAAATHATTSPFSSECLSKRKAWLDGQVAALDCLTVEDVCVINEYLVESERKGGFECLYPTAERVESYAYMFSATPRYLNTLMREWFAAGSHSLTALAFQRPDSVLPLSEYLEREAQAAARRARSKRAKARQALRAGVKIQRQMSLVDGVRAGSAGGVRRGEQRILRRSASESGRLVGRVEGSERVGLWEAAVANSSANRGEGASAIEGDDADVCERTRERSKGKAEVVEVGSGGSSELRGLLRGHVRTVGDSFSSDAYSAAAYETEGEYESGYTDSQCESEIEDDYAGECGESAEDWESCQSGPEPMETLLADEAGDGAGNNLSLKPRDRRQRGECKGGGGVNVSGASTASTASVVSAADDEVEAVLSASRPPYAATHSSELQHPSHPREGASGDIGARFQTALNDSESDVRGCTESGDSGLERAVVGERARPVSQGSARHRQRGRVGAGRQEGYFRALHSDDSNSSSNHNNDNSSSNHNSSSSSNHSNHSNNNDSYQTRPATVCSSSSASLTNRMTRSRGSSVVFTTVALGDRGVSGRARVRPRTATPRGSGHESHSHYSSAMEDGRRTAEPPAGWLRARSSTSLYDRQQPHSFGIVGLSVSSSVDSLHGGSGGAGEDSHGVGAGVFGVGGDGSTHTEASTLYHKRRVSSWEREQQHLHQQLQQPQQQLAQRQGESKEAWGRQNTQTSLERDTTTPRSGSDRGFGEKRQALHTRQLARQRPPLLLREKRGSMRRARSSRELSLGKRNVSAATTTNNSSNNSSSNNNVTSTRPHRPATAGSRGVDSSSGGGGAAVVGMWELKFGRAGAASTSASVPTVTRTIPAASSHAQSASVSGSASEHGGGRGRGESAVPSVATATPPSPVVQRRTHPDNAAVKFHRRAFVSHPLRTASRVQQQAL